MTFNPEPGTSNPAGQPLTLSVNASDPEGIAKVEFYFRSLGGGSPVQKIGEVTTAPFSFVWQNPPSGAYRLSAIATDNTGVASEAETFVAFGTP